MLRTTVEMTFVNQLRMKVELAFLNTFEQIISDKAQITEAIKVRTSSLKREKLPITLQELDALGIFNADGSLNSEAYCTHNIFIDVQRLDAFFLQHYCLSKNLSLREAIIFDAVIMDALRLVMEKFQYIQDDFNEQTALLHEEMPKTPKANQGKIRAALDRLEKQATEVSAILTETPKVVLTQLGAENIRLNSPLSYQPKPELLSAINSARVQYDQIKINNFMLRLNIMRSDYHILNRNVHKNDIGNLIKLVEEIQLNDAFNPTESLASKFEKMVCVIERAARDDMDERLRSFFAFNSPRPVSEFIHLLNHNKTDYHYPRLLAILLQCTYLENPELNARPNPLMPKDIIDCIQLGNDNRGIYANKIPSLISDKAEDFAQFQTSLIEEGSRLIPTQMYNQYISQMKPNNTQNRL